MALAVLAGSEQFATSQAAPAAIADTIAVTEFVRLTVDIIVVGGIAVPAAKRATSVIPIVFTLAPDPVGSGLVASLARPGGNVTGLSNQSSDLFGKRLEILRDVVPGLRRLAIIANSDNPQIILETGDAQAEARKLGLDVTTSKIRPVAARAQQQGAMPVIGFLHPGSRDAAARTGC